MKDARDGSRRIPGQPSQRQLRVGELVRHAVAQVLERGEIHDPDIAGKSITVTEVRMSPDLKVATAYIMPLGGEDVAIVAEALGRAAPYVRRRLGDDVALKFLPEIRFVVDETFDYANRIDRLLREAGDRHGDDDGA